MEARVGLLKCFWLIICAFFAFWIDLVGFWLIFRNFHQKWLQNGPKSGRAWAVPADPQKNHEHHRISHGLKPLRQGSFCFWSPFGWGKLWVKGQKTCHKRTPQNCPKGSPWREVGGECFAPLNLGILSYDRKTDQKVGIVCDHRTSPITPRHQ